MKSRLVTLLACALIGGAVGAGLKSAGLPKRQPAVSALPLSVSSAETQAAADDSTPTTKPNPAVPALPRPALDELRGAAPEVRLTPLVRWLPEATAQEVAALPEEDRLVLQEKSASALLSDYPERALAALPPIRPNAADPFLYSQIAVELAQSDPEKAAAWVAGFEEGSSKEWTAQNLVATWAKFDPEAATGWVENLPAGNSRDRAIVELARLQGITGGHEAALALAATVQDEGRRTEAAGLALQSLWYRDRAAAEAALAGVAISSDTRADLMAKLAKGDFQR